MLLSAGAPDPRPAPSASGPRPALESFANPHPDLPSGRSWEVRFECPEFTCLCPRTGQPDFATLRIRYVPGPRCVELKSLKLYLWSHRDVGAFHEDVTNRILSDLVAAIDPVEMTVEAEFRVRGGIHATVVATHRRPPLQAG